MFQTLKALLKILDKKKKKKKIAGIRFFSFFHRFLTLTLLGPCLKNTLSSVIQFFHVIIQQQRLKYFFNKPL